MKCCKSLTRLIPLAGVFIVFVKRRRGFTAFLSKNSPARFVYIRKPAKNILPLGRFYVASLGTYVAGLGTGVASLGTVVASLATEKVSRGKEKSPAGEEKN